MEKDPVKTMKIDRKFKIPLLAVAAILFLICGYFLYKASGESNASYFYESGKELALVDISPDETGGISQDSPIVLEWNRSVSVDAADGIDIYPSARGTWSARGNRLVFTPQKLAAGTYYTVSMAKGTVLNAEGDSLKEDIVFSFETEDPSLRIPDRNAFMVDGRYFHFSDVDTVSIPVSYLGEKEATVETSVYRAGNSSDFIRSFAGLFRYPEWAALSIGRYHASDRGFEEYSSAKLAIRDENDVSCVDLGSLPQGLYLVRLTVEGESCDIAVNVSNIDVGLFSDEGTLALWVHKDGRSYADAKVAFQGKNLTLDEHGFAETDYTFDGKELTENADFLAVTVSDDENDTVVFLTADDLTSRYQGNLFAAQKEFSSGASLSVSGSVFSPLGRGLSDTAILQLCSKTGVVKEKSVVVGNGYFSEELDDLALVGGSYKLCLVYQGKVLATDTVTVGTEEHELFMSVAADPRSISRGETVTYTVSVWDRKGNPVTDGEVHMNGEVSQSLDKAGQAVFSKAYDDFYGYTVNKSTTFSLTSPLGTAAKVSSCVTVEGEKTYALHSVKKEEFSSSNSDSGESLDLSLRNGKYTVAGEEDDVDLTLYYNGDYEVAPKAAPEISFENASLTVAAGKDIVFEGASAGAYRLAVVSLCRGTVAEGLCGETLAENSLAAENYGTVVANRVISDTDELYASFSSKNLDGSYFLRVALETAEEVVVVRYVPVYIEGVTLTCPGFLSYAERSRIALPFYIDSEEELSYTLSLGESIYTGTGKGKVSVPVDLDGTGIYYGKMTVRNEDSVVADGEFSFSVYHKMPMFYTLADSRQEGAYAVYEVKEEKEAAFKALFGVVSQPGDQILQRMSRTLFYQKFGDTVISDGSFCHKDLRSLQNADGGFGRRSGGESDLLLSVLVAEQDDFLYDRDSLCAYLKYRLETTTDIEMAALACWGLSYFDVDCHESMGLINEERKKSDRTLLYLAEGYEAVGDRIQAEKCYQQLKKMLTEDDGMLFMPDSTDQYNLANTAFMLDLAIKLETSEQQGLLNYLLQADISIQTGRYLLVTAILRMTDANDIAVADGDAPNGYTLLSLVDRDLSGIPSLQTSFTKEGEDISASAAGDTVDMHFSWEGTENNIYLIYVYAPEGVTVMEKNGLLRRNGFYEKVVSGSESSVTFRVEKEGESIAPNVFVVDLTTAEIIGKADPGKWKVTR